MESKTKCVHVKIYGNVQGVGFRNFVKNLATKLNLKGWVKNSHDGSVEAIFEGKEQEIKKILEYCKKGPSLAKVIRVEVSDEKLKGFNNFEIRY